jgi:hypothetical protein
MFPSLRFIVATMIMSLIVIIVASVPFASLRLIQRGLPSLNGGPQLPRTLVGTGSDEARLMRPVVLAPAAMPPASLNDPAPTRGGIQPAAAVELVPAVSLPLTTKTVADPDTRRATEPVATLAPAAVSPPTEAAAAPQAPPDVDMAVNKSPTKSSPHLPAEMPAQAPVAVSVAVSAAGAKEAPAKTKASVTGSTAPAAAPAATVTPTPQQKTAAVTPTEPAAKATTKPAVKKHRARRHHRKRARHRRVRPRPSNWQNQTSWSNRSWRNFGTPQ